MANDTHSQVADPVWVWDIGVRLFTGHWWRRFS